MVSTVEQPCPLCGSRPYRRLKQFPSGIVVGACKRCGSMYTPRRAPNPAALLDSQTFEASVAEYRAVADGRRDHYRRRVFERYLDWIGNYSSGTKLLDVGCAHGFFPALARSYGFEVTAIEPSAGPSRFAREVLELDVIQTTGDALPDDLGSFDVITMTDSLEYMPNPRTVLRQLISRLNAEGILLIKVPNGDYFRARARLETVAGRSLGAGAFTPDLRVIHYTKGSLRSLLIGLGLEPLVLRGLGPTPSSFHQTLGLVTRTTHAAGRLQELLTALNFGSPSLLAVASRRRISLDGAR